jgi:hypothetical protein
MMAFKRVAAIRKGTGNSDRDEPGFHNFHLSRGKGKERDREMVPDRPMHAELEEVEKSNAYIILRKALAAATALDQYLMIRISIAHRLSL